jgi:hypothetical protein
MLSVPTVTCMITLPWIGFRTTNVPPEIFPAISTLKNEVRPLITA